MPVSLKIVQNMWIPPTYEALRNKPLCKGGNVWLESLRNTAHCTQKGRETLKKHRNVPKDFILEISDLSLLS